MGSKHHFRRSRLRTALSPQQSDVGEFHRHAQSESRIGARLGTHLQKGSQTSRWIAANGTEHEALSTVFHSAAVFEACANAESPPVALVAAAAGEKTRHEESATMDVSSERRLHDRRIG